MLHSFLRSRLGPTSDADDALQETFFRIHRYIASYKIEQNALSWVFGIARNVAIDRIKERLKHRADEQIDIEQISAPAEAQADSIHDLEDILAQLSPEDRDLLTDRYIKEESYKKLAARRAISEQSARQKISRIIKKLKKKI